MNGQISRYDDTVYNEPYIAKDGCLYEQVTIRNQLVDVKLADFVPVLKAEITHDDGVEQRKLFRIAATHKTGQVLPEQTISADEMQSMKWLLQRWGQYGAVVPKQNVLAKVCHAIMQTKQAVRNETVYSQTGWRKLNGEWVFLMPHLDSKFTVELQGKLNSYRFTRSCDKSDLIYLSAMLDNSFAPPSVLLPLLSVTFLSPLNHFLKTAGCEPKFVTALIGKTGSRKSTLAALFLSFFGRFTASDLPMSFHDTANSILSNNYYLKDVLTCIDDFHPSGMFHEQEMRTIAQNISRYYGDRIGRARLNSKAELQASRPPTGNAIITAEYVPEISVSGSARYFNIELNENDVKLSELSEYQRLAEQNVLSEMMMLYVEWLKHKYLSDENEFTKMLSEKFLQYRSEFIEQLTAAKIKFHNRTPDMLSHLKIGMEFLLTFLHDHEQLTEQEVSSHTKSFVMILLQSCSLNAEIIVNENPTTRFCEKLKSLLDSGRCYVETRGLESQSRQKKCIGLQDSDHYYLFADAAHSEVRKLCSEQGEHFTISKNELLRQLRSEGLLLSRTSRNTISIRDNSNTVVNVAMLDKKKIEQRMSGDLCPPSTEVG
ncbi:protein of unknown function [Ruminococcus sp. YE71]|uniref:DUF927 domain-containing protein n=1 Tax=unclassified Ruminococcus TaxID=2608920 RepID=UPI00087E78C0|nr:MULTISPECIES: DUF927 domain-containing protein [unclassified Ruminococcus]SDA31369.1 protein of unknown function [Ruminococcus sp. YE78]SDA32252.1 protein of unknown function [Ruminococcus sp. YE78]SFW51559.1 protein of unknown function [Ruminococcus sp. YE71]SFW53087.1 protein of unknown function [Ruminococcus sp. YE71]